MTHRFALATLAVALAAAGLAGCNRTDPGASANANAPGSPGTGNDTVLAQPKMPDGPPGGPSGVKGSLPHTGSSGGDMMPGSSGSGVVGSTQPGTGLNGGLGTNGLGSGASGETGTMGAGPAGSGNSNSTPGAATGQR